MNSKTLSSSSSIFTLVLHWWLQWEGEGESQIIVFFKWRIKFGHSQGNITGWCYWVECCFSLLLQEKEAALSCWIPISFCSLLVDLQSALFWLLSQIECQKSQCVFSLIVISSLTLGTAMIPKQTLVTLVFLWVLITEVRDLIKPGSN